MSDQQASPHLSGGRTGTASLHQDSVCDGAGGDTSADESDDRFRFEPRTVFTTTTPWGNPDEGVDRELWQVVGRRWKSIVSFAHDTDDEPSSETRAIYVLENRCGERREKTEATLLSDDWRRVDIDLDVDEEDADA